MNLEDLATTFDFSGRSVVITGGQDSVEPSRLACGLQQTWPSWTATGLGEKVIAGFTAGRGKHLQSSAMSCGSRFSRGRGDNHQRIRSIDCLISSRRQQPQGHNDRSELLSISPKPFDSSPT
jgi:hypothetical protein